MTPGDSAAAAPAGEPLVLRFLAQALQNRNNRLILERLPTLGLDDAWLVAGCLFQTVWNLQSGRAPTAGIKDYDLFYFDATDLSEQAESAVGDRVQAAFRGLGITIEAKNQARVHTWYPRWFGQPYPALASTRDGIDRFLVPCTCVGLRDASGTPASLYAPHGLVELYQGVLRPNSLCDHRVLFRAKAASYRSRWPWLQITETAQPVAAPDD